MRVYVTIISRMRSSKIRQTKTLTKLSHYTVHVYTLYYYVSHDLPAHTCWISWTEQGMYIVRFLWQPRYLAFPISSWYVLSFPGEFLQVNFNFKHWLFFHICLSFCWFLMMEWKMSTERTYTFSSNINIFFVCIFSTSIFKKCSLRACKIQLCCGIKFLSCCTRANAHA